MILHRQVVIVNRFMRKPLIALGDSQDFVDGGDALAGFAPGKWGQSSGSWGDICKVLRIKGLERGCFSGKGKAARFWRGGA